MHNVILHFNEKKFHAGWLYDLMEKENKDF